MRRRRGDLRNHDPRAPRPGVIVGRLEPSAHGVLAKGDEPFVRDGRWRRVFDRTAATNEPLEMIAEIYRLHGARFRRVALAIIADFDASEDVVQDAFARAVHRRRSFRGTGDAVGWIWRIVVNTALSRHRRMRREGRLLEWTDLSVESASGPEAAEELDVREHVARLPERQRVVLFLRYYADLDYEAIGEILSVAPGTVGKLLHDARASIRRAVEEDADG